MLYLLDTNVLINLIRRKAELPPYSAISIIIVGELKAFSTKRKWGYQKRLTLEKILSEIPIFGLEFSLTDVYATVDAYSQGELMSDPLPSGTSARNMGKMIFGLQHLPYFTMPNCTHRITISTICPLLGCD